MTNTNPETGRKGTPVMREDKVPAADTQLADGLTVASKPLLDELVQEGARRMLSAALEAEVEAYLRPIGRPGMMPGGRWSCATAGRASGRWPPRRGCCRSRLRG